MKECNDHINSLVRDGTSQSVRFPDKLDPNSVKIDGRSENDLIEYAYEFASLLNFYNLDNQVEGSWQVFLQKLKDNPAGILSGDMTPQTALFLSFLRLFRKQQVQLNGLTKKHLDTFFHDVLRIKLKSAVADQVHVLFELAKNIDPTKLDAGTTLKAGKDADGVGLFYQLTEDMVVNHATVESIKSILVDEDSNDLVHCGEVANSVDGAGEEDLPKDDPKWPAFGKNQFATAEIGFALASPVLWLQEGTRDITVKLSLRADDDFSVPASALQNALKIYLSGEEEWLGPFYASPSIQQVSGIHQLQFEINLSETEKPVAYYNSEVLDGDFQTIYPIMKIIADTSSQNYLNSFLQGVILEDAKITADVSGIKTLDLENDQGTLDASKSFLPFGPEPVTGSSFQVGYEEAFTKKLDEFTIAVDWMDVPSSNLDNYYSSSYASGSKLNYSISSNQFKARMKYRNKHGEISSKTVNLFNSINNKSTAEYKVTENGFLIALIPQTLIKAQLVYATKSKISQLLQNKYHLLKGNKLKVNPFFKLNLTKQQSVAPEKGFVSFELLDDFLHKDYRQKYVQATVEYTSGDLNLPKEPYQPKVKQISLNYKASTSKVDLSQSSSDAFSGKDIEFFQLGAFGQREVHGYLLAQQTWLTNKRITLMPDYSQQGELLVGIKNISKGQILNLLVQVAEGSANPQKEKEPVSWSVLADNDWYKLDSEHLLADATNGFLKSGIVKINMPDKANTNHSWLGDGLVWLRASVRANPDAVCQLIGLHPQAVLAELVEPEKHPSHLSQGLAAETISKLQKSNAAIKKVKQPYASFGGYPKEKDEAYYTRVSERLRHKNRAVTIWDYERMVLQEFPTVSKVKCLNHTCETKERAPGHVNLILVPDLQNKNAVNILQPRVSKAMLEDVKAYMKNLAPSLAEIHVNNPAYEEVQLEFEVSFRTNYEFGFYSKQLNEELIEFLSPWSTGEKTEIHFGGRIEKSVLLKFVETREYVDFVTHFKMYHMASDDSQKVDTNTAIASNSRAILVSHSKHVIHNYNS